MARKSRKAVDTPVGAADERLWRTCIYARLSFEDEQKKESDAIGNQIALLERFIGEKLYLKLISVFKDVNQTGTNFERPGFKQMMDAVKTGAIDCIVVKDLSRFGRNYIETGTYLEQILPFLHVRFISVNDGYDSLNPNCQDEGYAVPLKNLIHDLYARDISQKTKSALAVKRSKGEFTGCVAAYGYLKGENGGLVIDEQTAPVVRDIFEWAADGMGDGRIAQKLNALGIPSPSQYRYGKGILKNARYADMQYWYKSAVRRILANPVYLGHMVQGKTASDLWGGGGCAALPPEQWAAIKNTHTPLVDAETFLAIRRIKRERRPDEGKAAKPQGSNSLKGLVFCGDCKRRMKRKKRAGANGAARYYFSCATYADISKNGCTKKRFDEPALRAILDTAISMQLALFADIDKMAARCKAEQGINPHQSAPEAEMAEAGKQLSRLSMLKSALYEDYREKRIDEAGYLGAKARCETAAIAFQGRLDALSMQKRCPDAMPTPQNPWLLALKQWGENETVTGEMRSGLIERVEIFSDQTVSIRFGYRDEFGELCRFIEADEKAGFL